MFIGEAHANHQRAMARRYIFNELLIQHSKRTPKPEIMFREIMTLKRPWARIVRRRGKPPLLVWNKGKPG